MTIKSIKVHLMGSEGTGWALDTDLSTTHDALRQCDVEFTEIEDADIVHGVWEIPLLTMPSECLSGKRILCHLPNDLARTFEQPCMARHARVGLWISHSRKAESDCQLLNLQHTYVPQAVNTRIFTNSLTEKVTREMLRQRWNIPSNSYVIGNFMRDSSAFDLSSPKPQKGVEMLVDILAGLSRMKLPIHVLLAGPRRHWIRNELSRLGIPFTFIGKIVCGDDNNINILSSETINLLYHASDLHLVTSRWEGGPRAVLEAAATSQKILCTPVGLAPDVLEPVSLIRSANEAILRIAEDIRSGVLGGTVAKQYERVLQNHTPEANAVRFRAIYGQINTIPIFQPRVSVSQPRRKAHRSRFHTVFETGFNVLLGRPRHQPGRGITVSLWHEFHKPPYGGGNQFMMALRPALERRGVRVLINDPSRTVDVHVCNSAWFDVEALRNAATRTPLRMVHRIDGPVSTYRSTDRTEDDKIFALNREFATATIFQSFWCYSRSLSLGYAPISPVVIYNAVDGKIFHPPRDRGKGTGTRIRIISSAWSDNPRKGLDIFKWLDAHLDFSRFEYTFVGRIKTTFNNIRHIPPQDSHRLAALLRHNDLFISASRAEPCSNALLEAMACGLPALYMDDGGNPELVQLGGLPFTGTDDILPCLNELAVNLDHYRATVHVTPIDHIAIQYINLFRTILDAPEGGLE